MNSQTLKTEQPKLAKRAEAAAWLARLRGPQRTADVERGFRNWMQADAEHAQAFEHLSERIEMVEQLRTKTLPEHWRPSHRARTRVRWMPQAIAASLVVAAALFWYLDRSRFSTSVGEQRTLALKDGTRVYLNTDTRVLVRYDKDRRQIELASGEALFEVARHSAWPFIVKAGEQRITALGTSFVVRRDGNELSVLLVEGKVTVSSSASTAALSPGQRWTIALNRRPTIDQPRLDKVTAWRQGQVALDGMSLGEAAREMNRYSAQKLIVESPEAASVKVGGFFRMGDSASFARAVAATYGFRVIEQTDEIVLAGVPRN
jgi:transmembrane sensor